MVNLTQTAIDAVLYVLFPASLWLAIRAHSKVDQSTSKTSLSKTSQYALLAVLLAFSAVLQYFFTSAGADVGTWQLIVNVFLSNGLNFYAIGNNTLTPLYVPVMLAAFHLLLPAASWIIIMRMPDFIANLVIGTVLFFIFRGRLGLIASMLFLFNPYYYVYSIVNGEPDAPMLAFLLGAVYILARNKGVVKSAVLMGLAFMTSQAAVFVIFPTILSIYARNGRRAFLMAILGFAAVVVILSIPFMINVDLKGNPANILSCLSTLGGSSNAPCVHGYINGVFLLPFAESGASGGGIPSAFGGLWSFTYFVAQTTQLNLSMVYRLEGPVTLALMLLTAWLCLRGRIDFYEGALLGGTALVLGTARGNPWHLIIVIPFLTVVLLRSPDLRVRASTVLASLAFQAYRLADNFSYLFNAAPPYFLGEIITFFTFSALFLMVFNHARARANMPSKQLPGDQEPLTEVVRHLEQAVTTERANSATHS